MSSVLLSKNELLTVDEVAAELRIVPRTVRRAIEAGELAAVRIGGTRLLRVHRGALDDWLAPAVRSASR
jgi:excisionase family DNA binding protein